MPVGKVQRTEILDGALGLTWKEEFDISNRPRDIVEHGFGQLSDGTTQVFNKVFT